jgi:hypothetical protein
MQFYSKPSENILTGHYSVIQGDDGGMEKITMHLILGEGSYDGNYRTRNMAHSWFQHVLASTKKREKLMVGLDEGFASHFGGMK